MGWSYTNSAGDEIIHDGEATEEATQHRLEREARETFLGRLGNRDGNNIARVEVSWYSEYTTDPVNPLNGSHTEWHAGFYTVHATGDETAAREEGTIYAVFHDLVHKAMQAKVDDGKIDGYQLDDISSL